MKLLAIDTATEQCSVALSLDGVVTERCVRTPRGHAELVLPMIDQLISEAGIALTDLHGLAFGRGPGAFTGVRIAVGVAQGLALGTGLPVVPVSDLAAVAQHALAGAVRVLVCMDARMGEVYWGVFERTAAGLASPIAPEQVGPPSSVTVDDLTGLAAAGTGFRAYPELRQHFSTLQVDDDALPHARAIATLAGPELASGRGVPAREALPVYVRDRVAWPKAPS